MLTYLYLYTITFVLFLVIDLVWLNFIAKKLYQKEIGNLLLKKPHLIPAVLFYLLFVFALVVLILIPGIKEGAFGKTLLMAALFGLTTYATYDLTNLATLKGWNLKITIIDLIWGTSISTLTTLLGYLIGNKIV